MALKNIMKKRMAIGLMGVAGLGAVAAVALTMSQGENPLNIGVMEPCGNITYFHCETNRCVNGVFYLDYNPDTDRFSSPYGSVLYQGEQTNIRDEPHRRYGARGVRAAHDGKYGFYSINCF
jgi:hypothetical protein